MDIIIYPYWEFWRYSMLVKEDPGITLFNLNYEYDQQQHWTQVLTTLWLWFAVYRQVYDIGRTLVDN